jgi:hypothetical protein
MSKDLSHDAFLEEHDPAKKAQRPDTGPGSVQQPPMPTPTGDSIFPGGGNNAFPPNPPNPL